jgi:hypothetical protein
MERPGSCRYASAFHFHATLTGMHGLTPIRHLVRQARASRQKRLLASTGMMEPLHRASLPLDSVVALV